MRSLIGNKVLLQKQFLDVPGRDMYAHVDGNGFVDLILQLVPRRGEEQGLELVAFATHSSALTAIGLDFSAPALKELILLASQGKLVPFGPIAEAHQGCLLFRDRRPQHKGSYLMWLGVGSLGSPALHRSRVYYQYGPQGRLGDLSAPELEAMLLHPMKCELSSLEGLLDPCRCNAGSGICIVRLDQLQKQLRASTRQPVAA